MLIDYPRNTTHPEFELALCNKLQLWFYNKNFAWNYVLHFFVLPQADIRNSSNLTNYKFQPNVFILTVRIGKVGIRTMHRTIITWSSLRYGLIFQYYTETCI